MRKIFLWLLSIILGVTIYHNVFADYYLNVYNGIPHDIKITENSSRLIIRQDSAVIHPKENDKLVLRGSAANDIPSLSVSFTFYSFDPSSSPWPAHSCNFALLRERGWAKYVKYTPYVRYDYGASQDTGKPNCHFFPISNNTGTLVITI